MSNELQKELQLFILFVTINNYNYTLGGQRNSVVSALDFGP